MRDKRRSHASSLCSGKVTSGLKCAVAAGESRLAFDLLQVEQVSRLPERVVLAAAPKQPSAIIPARNLLQHLLLLSLCCFSVYWEFFRLFFFFSINIIITIMTLIQRRLIIIVISDSAGIFVVVIFILRVAGFHSPDDSICRQQQKCDIMHARGARVSRASRI